MDLGLDRILAAHSEVARANADLARAHDAVVTHLTKHLLALPPDVLPRAFTLVHLALAEAERWEDNDRNAVWRNLAARHHVALPEPDEAADLLLLLEAEPSDERKAALDGLGLRPVRDTVTAYRGVSRPSALAIVVSGQEDAHWRILPKGTPEPRPRGRSLRDKSTGSASDAASSNSDAIDVETAAKPRCHHLDHRLDAQSAPRAGHLADLNAGDAEWDSLSDWQDSPDRDADHGDDA